MGDCGPENQSAVRDALGALAAGSQHPDAALRDAVVALRNHPEFLPGRLFSYASRASARSYDGYRLCSDVALEIAGVIKCLDEVLRNSPLASCTKHVILTGVVGECFGFVGHDDVLVDRLGQFLGREAKVLRSRIPTSSERELAGFVGATSAWRRA
jgi:hypothetical protein